MNKPQAEGRVNSRLYSRTQEKKVQHSSAIKNNEAQFLVYLKYIEFIYHNCHFFPHNCEDCFIIANFIKKKSE